MIIPFIPFCRNLQRFITAEILRHSSALEKLAAYREAATKKIKDVIEVEL